MPTTGMNAFIRPGDLVKQCNDETFNPARFPEL